MVLSEARRREYLRRLMLSRMRILCNHGFYGLLLMHMKFSLDQGCETAATDGVRIFFHPDFLDRISDPELDYVLLHEILHVVLQHCSRRGDRDSSRFQIACDIVVNSHILRSFHMEEEKITLAQYGPGIHRAPNGREGCEYTAEQVYEMLDDNMFMGSEKESGETSKLQAAGGFSESSENSVDQERKKQRKETSGEEDSEAGSREASGQRKERGQTGEEDFEDGSRDTSERRKQGKGKKKEIGTGAQDGRDAESDQTGNVWQMMNWDDHSRWEDRQEDKWHQDVWSRRFMEACEAVKLRDPSNSRGLLPAFALRMLEELGQPRMDWRTILNSFIQEEITDYTFMPPDRRMGECEFFLPDFQEREETVSDILFFIDTSGSMSDEMITEAYSEVKGAIDQFHGRLKGWLGFFDAAVTEPEPFSDVEELLDIRPFGGGGTDFSVIFDYIRKHRMEELPTSIIIFTDGLAPFPEESEAMGIPVLWLLNNKTIQPPWGKTARMPDSTL